MRIKLMIKVAFGSLWKAYVFKSDVKTIGCQGKKCVCVTDNYLTILVSHLVVS